MSSDRMHRYLWPIIAGMLFCWACSSDPEDHVHEPGAHGGFIVAVGQDHHHAEIHFTEGQFRLYMLDQDQAKVIDIEEQEIEVLLRPFGDARARKVILKPTPQAGDPQGRSSLFVGELPADLPPSLMLVTVPVIQINTVRYRFSFSTSEPIMPAKVSSDEERKLYLEPGGAYTQADVDANGSQTASQKFAGFQAQHDIHPQAGSRICPITQTAANPRCSWIIGGQEYQFCCPPCVDEFLKRAKTDANSIAPADSYVQK